MNTWQSKVSIIQKCGMSKFFFFSENDTLVALCNSKNVSTLFESFDIFLFEAAEATVLWPKEPVIETANTNSNGPRTVIVSYCKK